MRGAEGADSRVHSAFPCIFALSENKIFNHAKASEYHRDRAKDFDIWESYGRY